MKAARLIGAFSLLSLLVALGVVLAGQQAAVKTLLAPGGAGDKSRSIAESNSVIGKADISSTRTSLSTLISDTIDDNPGSGTITDPQNQLLQLQNEEPEIPLGKPIKTGGVSMQIFDHNEAIVFCARPNYYYVCQSLNLTTRAQGSGQSSQLAIASYQAKVVGQNAKAAQPSSPNSGQSKSSTQEGLSPGAQSAVNQAKQWQKNGLP